jgi:hypothetical protein
VLQQCRKLSAPRSSTCCTLNCRDLGNFFMFYKLHDQRFRDLFHHALKLRQQWESSTIRQGGLALHLRCLLKGNKVSDQISLIFTLRHSCKAFLKQMPASSQKEHCWSTVGGTFCSTTCARNNLKSVKIVNNHYSQSFEHEELARYRRLRDSPSESLSSPEVF